MDESSLAQFIEALHADPALRERVVHAEREASSGIGRDAEAIIAIAADAGFDLSGWSLRPDYTTPTPTKQELELSINACCFVVTSTL
jgi:hypothetical protein